MSRKETRALLTEAEALVASLRTEVAALRIEVATLTRELRNRPISYPAPAPVLPSKPWVMPQRYGTTCQGFAQPKVTWNL